MKSRSTGSEKIDLLLISGLALYAESVLIRWMGAEIRMFAYLKNFTLLAAFLGLGLGMLRRRESRNSWALPSLMSLLVLTMVFSAQLRLTRLFFPDSGIAQWAGNLNSPGLIPYVRETPMLRTIMTPFSDRAVPWALGAMAFIAGAVLFVIMVLIFSYLGQRIGELLRVVQPPLKAYTLNLVGSLAGTLVFVILVLLTSPPWVWFVPIVLCLVYFSDHRLRDGAILTVALIAAIVVGHSASVFWSPYRLSPMACWILTRFQSASNSSATTSGRVVRLVVPISERLAMIHTVPSGSIPRKMLGCSVARSALVSCGSSSAAAGAG